MKIDYVKDSDNIISKYQRLYRPDLTRGEGKLLEDFLYFLTHDLEEHVNDLAEMWPICNDCPYWEVCKPPYSCAETEVRFNPTR